ncbi:MAG: CoA pyrophosphatase [Proteobacteria bacterium]|nr:CoA pyrophosphatase [Pseudomonadota bacterium]
MDADTGLFRSREDFLARVTDRLGTYPSDFQPEVKRITASERTLCPQLAAGVLVTLFFRESPSPGGSETGGFIFQLIKRSSLVTQPGDLSCPGGMIHPIFDRLLRPLLIHGPFPIVRGRARSYALNRGSQSFRITTLFLANALRETWEEIGLPPWRVRYLGPLPTYSLARFRRTIFPLAGFAESACPPRPNREVEKIVEIPLAAFFQEGQIGCYTLSVPDPKEAGASIRIRYPCLIHRNQDGSEEILWGATFHILTRFLAIVMDYHLPDWVNGPFIHRTLRPDYLVGRASS